MKNALIPTLGYMGFLLLVSAIPDTLRAMNIWKPLALLSPAIHNLLHIPAYGLLALLWSKTLKEYGTVTSLNLLAAVAMASAYGLTTEFIQVWIPGRCPSLQDWLFDIAGALAATMLISIGKFEKRFDNAATYDGASCPDSWRET